MNVASDYNRSLPAPIRWAHIAVSVVLLALRPIIRWGAAPGRVTWFPYLAIGLLLIILLFPLDERITRVLTSFRLGGDVRREIEAAQQYGQLVSSILVAAVIWLQDPARRRRLADWAAAFVITGVLATFLKIFLGRPRPVLNEPEMFLGPLGAYPLGTDVGIRHSWEIWAGISSKLWSMPSSHTAYIAVMAVFIAMLYPRLRYLAFGMIAVVGFGRMVTGAHYFTDVIAGAALGLAVCHTVVAFRWGQIALDVLARRQSERRIRAAQVPQRPERPIVIPKAFGGEGDRTSGATIVPAAAPGNRG